jgi:predicted translin family RNA/ssDNA-binding protein
MEQLHKRFAELGEVASRFLEGLLKKQRYAKRHLETLRISVTREQIDEFLREATKSQHPTWNC